MEQPHFLEELRKEVEAFVRVKLYARAFSDGEISAIVDNVMGDPNSPVRKHLVEKLRGLSEPRSTVRGRRVILSGDFTYEQQGTLKAMFENVAALEFRPGPPQPHLMACALRKIEHFLIMSSVVTDRIVDIGGNPLWHVKNTKIKCHCCNPIADVKDPARQQAWGQRLEQYLKPVWFGSDYHLLKDMTTFRCNKSGEDCDAQARTLVMFHVYDISLVRLADIMEKHGADYLYGTQMMPYDRVWRDSGVIPLIDAEYRRTSDGKIKFNFVNDASFTYKHDAAVLEQYTHDTVITSSLGNDFVYQIVWSKPHGVVFSVFRGLQPMNKGTKLYTAAMASATQMVKLRTYDYDPCRWERNALVERIIHVPSSVFEIVLSKAIAYAAKEFTRQSVVQLLKAYSQGFDVNGRELLDAKLLSPDDVGPVAVGIYLLAYKYRKDMGKITAVYESIEDKKRAYGRAGILGRVRDIAYACVERFTNGVCDTVSEKMHDLGKWFTDEEVDYTLANMLVEIPVHYLGNTVLDDLKKLNTSPDNVPVIVPDADDFDYENLCGDMFGEASKDDDESDCSDDEDTFVDADSVAESEETCDVAESGVNPEKEVFTVLESDNESESAYESVMDIWSQTDDAEFEADRRAREKHRDDLDRDAERIRDLRALEEYIDYVTRERDGKLDMVVEYVQLSWSPDLNHRFPEIFRGEEFNQRPIFATCVPGPVVDSYERGQGRTKRQTLYNVINSATSSVAGVSYMVGYDIDNKKIVKSRPIRNAQKEIINHSWPAHTKNLFLCDHFKIWLYHKKLPALRMARDIMKSGDYIRPRYYVVAGVGGSGKSKRIQALFGPEDILVARSLSSTETSRYHFTHPDYGIMNEEEASFRVRTVDSYLINSDMYAKCLHVDEAYMMHYGEVVALMAITHCKEAVLYGDPKQITFVKRVPMTLTHETSFEPLRYDVMPVSTRYPPSIAAAVSDIYGGMIYSTVKMQDRFLPKKVDINSILDVPNEAGLTYICPYRTDRDLMVAKGYKNVYTPEEIQGATVDRVALVQLTTKLVSMFNNKPFMNVAFGRTRGEFTFYTVNHHVENYVTRAVRRGRNWDLIRAATYNPAKHGGMIRQMTPEEYRKMSVLL